MGQADKSDLRSAIAQNVQHILGEDSSAGGPYYGASIGIVEPATGLQETLYFGKLLAPGATEPEAPSAVTQWEIGSVTKTFTATLFAEALASGKLSLEEAAYPYFSQAAGFPAPPSPTTTSWSNLQAAQLVQLANYTSGLPDVPSDPKPTTVANMWKSLPKITIGTPGDAYLYSDLGFALLAYSLAPGGSKPLATLYRSLLLQPLGMTNTTLFTEAAAFAHLPKGYLHDGSPAPAKNPNWPAFDGAGALVTTAPDFLQWLRFNMGLTKPSALAAAWPFLRHPSVKAPNEDTGKEQIVSLAWGMTSEDGSASEPITYFKNGGVPAFTSYITYAAPGQLEKATCGVCVTTNRGTKHTKTETLNPAEQIGKAVLQLLLAN